MHAGCQAEVIIRLIPRIQKQLRDATRLFIPGSSERHSYYCKRALMGRDSGSCFAHPEQQYDEENNEDGGKDHHLLKGRLSGSQFRGIA